MRLVIEINCDNAAFAETELFPEVWRIIDELKDNSDLAVYGNDVILWDINGNRVGYAGFRDVD